MRTVMVVKNDKWERCGFGELKKDDIFRLFEANGNPVINNEGFTIFKAISDAYLNAEDIWQVDIIDTLNG